MTKKKGVNKQERVKIAEMIEEGASPKKISDELNIAQGNVDREIISITKEKAEEVADEVREDNTFHKLEGDEIEAQEEGIQAVEQDWKEEVGYAIETLTQSGLSEDKALALVKEALPKIDLTQKPDYEVIVNRVMASGGELLQTMTYGTSSVVSMTGAASKSQDSTATSSPKLKYHNEIFRPKG